MQHLQQEQMHGRDGIEDAFPPDMAHGLANFANHLGLKEISDIGLDLPHGGEDTASHPWPPVGVRFEAPAF
jgi:hypothetical protein